jgi:hypothetical protein
MNYTIEANIVGRDVKTVFNYIPKSQKLTLLLKTNDTNIQNIKLKTGNEEHYMVKDKSGFTLKLNPNMVNIGSNELVFVLESRIPNRKTITEIECNPLVLDLTKENISNPVESNLERLQHEITKIIFSKFKES